MNTLCVVKTVAADMSTFTVALATETGTELAFTQTEQERHLEVTDELELGLGSFIEAWQINGVDGADIDLGTHSFQRGDLILYKEGTQTLEHNAAKFVPAGEVGCCQTLLNQHQIKKVSLLSLRWNVTTTGPMEDDMLCVVKNVKDDGKVTIALESRPHSTLAFPETPKGATALGIG